MNCSGLAMDRGNLAASEICAKWKWHRECQEMTLCPMRGLFQQWKDWGIPELERRLLRDDLLGASPLDGRPALAEMRALLSAGKVLVVLSGRTRIGKTVAATWALSRRGGRYVRACDLTRIDCEMAPLLRANTLVVDQVGFEPIGKTEWALGQFLDVIDSRYASERLTILCANLTRVDLEKRYGKAFSGRLREGGRFVLLESA